MTRQHWSTTNKLAAQRSADLRRLATLRRRGDAALPRAEPREISTHPGRVLVETGWRLGGDGALRSASRRRAA
ncbi:MAG: hypothetical protein M0010_20670 [Actinomycetota bacterium]|nr:hypothetical protein [Actinomycetota bacterium]